MSAPKNNLDDVLKRRASGSTVLEAGAGAALTSVSSKVRERSHLQIAHYTEFLNFLS